MKIEFSPFIQHGRNSISSSIVIVLRVSTRVVAELKEGDRVAGHAKIRRRFIRGAANHAMWCVYTIHGGRDRIKCT